MSIDTGLDFGLNRFLLSFLLFLLQLSFYYESSSVKPGDEDLSVFPQLCFDGRKFVEIVGCSHLDNYWFKFLGNLKTFEESLNLN